MRKLLLLGLCLALALQGAVQASVIEKPCPMQKAGTAHALAKTTAAKDCCNDADTAVKTGKACKAGQACLVAGAWLTGARDLCSLSPAAVSRVCSQQPFALGVDTSGHWRPPALS
jgi:hypothetical protein